MSKKSEALNIAKDYEEQLKKTGKFVCNHCNRTGINPNYRDINKIVRALDGGDAFYCLHCYGKKEIDWVEYASGYFEQDLKNRRLDIAIFFLYSIRSYVLYLINGENHFDKKAKKWMHYDLVNGYWQVSTRAVGSIRGQNSAGALINKAVEEGYTDDHRYGDFLNYRQGDFYLNPVEIIKNIKTELINAKDISVKRLLEINEELDLTGITIEELERF